MDRAKNAEAAFAALTAVARQLEIAVENGLAITANFSAGTSRQAVGQNVETTLDGSREINIRIG